MSQSAPSAKGEESLRVSGDLDLVEKGAAALGKIVDFGQSRPLVVVKSLVDMFEGGK